MLAHIKTLRKFATDTAMLYLRHFGKLEALCSLVLENLRNFQKSKQGLHDGSTRFAWTVISISVYSGFLRTFKYGVAYSSTLLLFYKRSCGS